jgi:hypothetical protein
MAKVSSVLALSAIVMTNRNGRLAARYEWSWRMLFARTFSSL